MVAVLNIDESPANSDWLHTKWRMPAYKSNPFFRALDELEITLTEFKKTMMYRQAVTDGAIVNDEWVPKKDRRKS